MILQEAQIARALMLIGYLKTLSTKLTIAKARMAITRPITALVIVLLAFCTWLSLPAEVAYIMPPTTINITATAPAMPRRRFVIVLAKEPKLAGPPSEVGAVRADCKNNFIMA